MPPWRRRLELQETASAFTSSFAVGPSTRVWYGIPLAQLIRKDKDQRPPKGTGYPLEARGLQKGIGAVRTNVCRGRSYVQHAALSSGWDSLGASTSHHKLLARPVVNAAQVCMQ